MTIHSPRKPVIGIVPPGKLYGDDVPHRDMFLFGNPYLQRIEKHNAVPVGILPTDGHVDTEALFLSDGFLLAGGNKIWPYHLQVIEHAVRTRKPLLGICLGMQAISTYVHVQAWMEAHGGDTLQQFEAMKKDRYMFTHPVQGHDLENVTRETAERSRHPIEIKPGSRLHDAMGEGPGQAVSLHAYRIAPVVPGLKVSAVAPDGTVEGVEYGGHIIGVQFHPEVEDAWDPLFEAFLSGDWVRMGKRK